MDKSVYDILVARLQIVFKSTNVNKLDSVQAHGLALEEPVPCDHVASRASPSPRLHGDGMPQRRSPL